MFDFQFPGLGTRRIKAKLKAENPFDKAEFIKREIRRFFNSRKRHDMLVGQRYYMGRHDILDKKRTAIGEDGELTELGNLPNNKITDNCYRRLVQQKVNYLLGKPLLIKSENSGHERWLKKYFTPEFQGLMRQLAADGLNCGLGYLYIYTDDKGELAFRTLRPYEIIPGWADEGHTKLDYVIRVYHVELVGKLQPLTMAEYYTTKGVETYRLERGELILEKREPYFRIGKKGYNWDEIPIIPFKYCEDELPLINAVKPLQDALNSMLSAYEDSMQEDNRNTILVIKNYDGENLGEFRRNLSTYGAVKVRTIDGVEGSIETLSIKTDGENYNAITELLKRTMIENGKGFDTKALRETGSPNQMNIQSMYADIDLDANGMEAEMQQSLKRVVFFIGLYLFNTQRGNFIEEDAEIIFNRDVLINENEAIDGCVKSMGLISRESLLAQHPYVKDVAAELERLEREENKGNTDS